MKWEKSHCYKKQTKADQTKNWFIVGGWRGWIYNIPISSKIAMKTLKEETKPAVFFKSSHVDDHYMLIIFKLWFPRDIFLSVRYTLIFFVDRKSSPRSPLMTRPSYYRTPTQKIKQGRLPWHGLSFARYGTHILISRKTKQKQTWFFARRLSMGLSSEAKLVTGARAL